MISLRFKLHAGFYSVAGFALLGLFCATASASDKCEGFTVAEPAAGSARSPNVSIGFVYALSDVVGNSRVLVARTWSSDGWPSGGLQAGLRPIQSQRTKTEKLAASLIGQKPPSLPSPQGSGLLARLARLGSPAPAQASRRFRSAAVSPDQKHFALATSSEIYVYDSSEPGKTGDLPRRLDVGSPSPFAPRGVVAISNKLIVTAERSGSGVERFRDRLIIRGLDDLSKPLYAYDDARDVRSVLISRDETKIYFADGRVITEVELPSRVARRFSKESFPRSRADIERAPRYEDLIDSIAFVPGSETLLVSWRAASTQNQLGPATHFPVIALLDFSGQRVSQAQELRNFASQSIVPRFVEGIRDARGLDDDLDQDSSKRSIGRKPSDTDYRVMGVTPTGNSATALLHLIPTQPSGPSREGTIEPSTPNLLELYGIEWHPIQNMTAERIGD